eukprot:scaffold1778_cov246-Pinguiococcus_pyrenoidosus.AAC.7
MRFVRPSPGFRALMRRRASPYSSVLQIVRRPSSASRARAVYPSSLHTLRTQFGVTRGTPLSTTRSLPFQTDQSEFTNRKVSPTESEMICTWLPSSPLDGLGIIWFSVSSVKRGAALGEARGMPEGDASAPLPPGGSTTSTSMAPRPAASSARDRYPWASSERPSSNQCWMPSGDSASSSLFNDSEAVFLEP